MTENPLRRKAACRLTIVASYLIEDMAVTVFAERYNAKKVSPDLLEESGPIDAEDLDRWADICMGVAE